MNPDHVGSAAEFAYIKSFGEVNQIVSIDSAFYYIPEQIEQRYSFYRRCRCAI